MIVPSTPLDAVCFVCVDVETTGLDPRRDEILEIGAVKVLAGEVVEEFDTMVHVDRRIPAGAKRIHGISKKMLAGKPPIQEAMSSFLHFAGDCVLVEHSYKAFDIAFLEHANGAPLPITAVNTHTLSLRLFPFIPKHSLSECCRRHGIVIDGAHRALGDARATAQLLVCLLEICRSRYPLLQDLMKVAAVER